MHRTWIWRDDRYTESWLAGMGTVLPVSRADVNHVLSGLSMPGHVFDDGPNDAGTLAQKLANNVRSLCLREQFVLDEQADKTIKDWIGYK